MKPIVPSHHYILHFCFLFLLCSYAATRSAAQAPDLGKSYINVTKGLNGGTVETNDILEIRASFVVRTGTFDSCSYSDVIPAGTTYIPGTIRVLTNEGKIYKQFTDARTDDAGWITGTNVRINLGYNPGAAPATPYRRGRIANNHKPSFYGSSCIMIASFRVQVTALLGANISTGGGTITYRRGTDPLVTVTLPNNIVRVYQNFGICANTVGVNSIGTETNGTFGSGRPRNRGTSGNVPVGYTFSPVIDNGPNDYYYGIANNTSTRGNYTTSNSWAKPDNSSPSHRVFSVWDIIGDHTGAADPALGNPPADTVANADGGYMLIINAAYRIDSAFQQTISNLCPNTYYEISCWMRNICSKCGCDSNGKGATNTSGPVFYIPTGPGDSSGVAPNITFEVDGVDYYTTGNLMYSGQWVKKGFTFRTGMAQTSFTLKFFNNAPGGGGNDWVLDDISVATCSPDMRYSPSVNPTVCEGNAITIYDTVKSFFDNYTYYKWQRSTDNGATWTDITAPAGPATVAWNGTAWEYVNAYTIPPANTTLADSADQYRMVVATTMDNLSNANCRFTDGGNIITLHVLSCGPPLALELLSFTGRWQDNKAWLSWTSGREYEPLQYDVERSTDGVSFITAGVLGGHGINDLNTYSFTDQPPAGAVYYYRIKASNAAGKVIYSRTIQLLPAAPKLDFITIINPFSNHLSFNIGAPRNSTATIELINQSGYVVKRMTAGLTTGHNPLQFAHTGDLAPGIYILRVSADGLLIRKTVLKQ